MEENNAVTNVKSQPTDQNLNKTKNILNDMNRILDKQMGIYFFFIHNFMIERNQSFLRSSEDLMNSYVYILEESFDL